MMSTLRPRVIAMALALACASTGCDDEVVAPAPITDRLELRDDMRELWTAHVAWTRFHLMSRIGGLPDTRFAWDRLIQNQDDLGDAIRPFYGDDAGDQLTVLLREHIALAEDVVDASASGESAQIDPALGAWTDNADEIARFLADANPAWSFEELQTMLYTHLEQTMAEANARLAGDWAGDVEAYDEVVAHILVMADVLADGIAEQHSDLVAASPITARDETLHVSMRALWQDHVTWTRVYIISAVGGLPDAPFAAERLLRNQDDIGDAIRPLYGDAAGDRLTALLREHITGAAELVTAAIEGDPQALSAANAAWYANADEISSFLAEANPAWPLEDVRAMMHAHLDQLIVETMARITGDWVGDVAAYDEIVTHILMMADVLSGGIATQFPDPDAPSAPIDSPPAEDPPDCPVERCPPVDRPIDDTGYLVGSS